MSSLILGGHPGVGKARIVLSSLSTRHSSPNAPEAVFIINDQLDQTLHHLRHALKLRESTPSLAIMVVTEVAKSWSPVEAMINAEIIDRGSYRTAALARSALEEHWPKWKSQVSDEAVTFEYQEFK